MFSENQVRQLYVVKSVETLNSKVDLTKSSGDIALRQLALKSGVYGNEFYFQYRGATADSLLRSDLIDKSNSRSGVQAQALSKLRVARSAPEVVSATYRSAPKKYSRPKAG